MNTKSYLPKLILIFLSTLIIFNFASTALAHRVVIFGWEKEGMIHTQSKFSDGAPLKQGRIKVFDSSGAALLQGLSDERGQFSFKTPQTTPLTVVLLHDGHRSKWYFKPQKKRASKPAARQTTDQTAQTRDNAELSRDDIRLIVEKAVDKKLEPILRILAEQSVSHISFKDILGGLGYILGLVGLGAYLQYRKKQRP